MSAGGCTGRPSECLLFLKLVTMPHIQRTLRMLRFLRVLNLFLLVRFFYLVGLSKNIGFSCFFLQRIERDRERDLWRDERGHGVRPRKKINEEGGMPFPFPWGTSALLADSGVVPDAKARERERERRGVEVNKRALRIISQSIESSAGRSRKEVVKTTSHEIEREEREEHDDAQ